MTVREIGVAELHGRGDDAGARAWSLSGGTQGWAKAGHPIESDAVR